MCGSFRSHVQVLADGEHTAQTTHNGTAEEALKQIDEKDYLIPYVADHRKLVKVGVDFNKDTRNIGHWLGQ